MTVRVPVAALLSSVGCCPASPASRRLLYQWSVLLLTFLAYTSYHLSRKPISIVKNSRAFLDCGPGNHTTNTTCTSWISQIDGKSEQEAKTFLGLLDTSYLFSYAFFMFGSGFVAERMDLRYYLALGMIASGVSTFLFGLAYNTGIHNLWYFLAVQVVTGMFQATGWPGVVSVMANWYGKGRRGLIMGLWNSHTSLGNILGSLIAGAFVKYNWGLSFTVPGLIIAGVGFLLFLCLVPRPELVGMGEETSRDSQWPRRDTEAESAPLMESKSDESEPEELTGVVEVEQEEAAIGFWGALKIPGVVEFSLCLFFSKLVSYTFLYWLPNYIHSVERVDASESAVLSTIFDVGGIVGGAVAGMVGWK